MRCDLGVFHELDFILASWITFGATTSCWPSSTIVVIIALHYLTNETLSAYGWLRTTTHEESTRFPNSIFCFSMLSCTVVLPKTHNWSHPTNFTTMSIRFTHYCVQDSILPSRIEYCSNDHPALLSPINLFLQPFPPLSLCPKFISSPKQK